MRQFIKIILVIFIMIFSIQTFSQQVVYDPSVFGKLGEEMEQINQQIDIAEKQLNNATEQLNAEKSAIEQLKNSQYEWSNVASVINDLGNTIQKVNGIAYNAGNVDQQFKQYFPGYQSTTNYKQFYQDLVNKTQNTLNGVLQSIGSSAQDFSNEQSRLNFLQQQAQNAVGQTQAIQAASQIASEQVSQIQLLRQSVLAQTNAQTMFFAEQIQKDATPRAEEDQVIDAGTTTAPDIGHSGQPITVPDF